MAEQKNKPTEEQIEGGKTTEKPEGFEEIPPIEIEKPTKEKRKGLEEKRQEKITEIREKLAPEPEKTEEKPKAKLTPEEQNILEKEQTLIEADDEAKKSLVGGDKEKARYTAPILRRLFFRKKWEQEYGGITEPIADHPTFQEDGEKIHHWPFNRRQHLEAAAKVAFGLAKLFGRDPKDITQAALIHDIQSDWGKVQGAVVFAKELNLSPRAQALVSEQKVSIKGSGLDSFIVKASDMLVTLGETLGIVGYILRKPWERIPLIIRRTIHEMKKVGRK